MSMYEEFYGLRANPFTLKTDPKWLYLSHTHRAALGMLEYSIVQQAVFSVITGPIGSGKSTLAAKILGQVDQDMNVAHLNFVHADMGSILAWILYGFGQDYESNSRIALYDRLKSFCLEQVRLDRRNVVLIDEAQNLTAGQLEEIRTIANLNFGAIQAVQIIFVGQPEFRKVLAAPELEQLRQRISVDYSILPLSKEETHEYIEHRLREAGSTYPIFDHSAVEFIHGLTGGTPRKINIVCDTLMAYGYLDEVVTIDRDYTIDVMKDRSKAGMVALGIAGPTPAPTAEPSITLLDERKRPQGRTAP